MKNGQRRFTWELGEFAMETSGKSEWRGICRAQAARFMVHYSLLVPH
jgi:hypothetical protein